MDNLANNWGTTLVLLSNHDMKKKNLNGAFSLFEASVRRATGEQFTLEKITECGSEANLYAVNDACGGNTDGVLIGAGMYVAGDNGPLQAWSTTAFSIETGPTYLCQPKDATQYTKEHVIPLPYFIPCPDFHPIQREKYEDECLKQLHIRCLLNKLNGRPTRVLFLELVLCGNGSMLSKRALKGLGRLAKHHDFWILVDEVLTGGRCGTMLLLQQQPKIFRERVSHVTMGKWMDAGLVLVGEGFKRSKDKELKHLPSRGPSTKYDCTKSLMYFDHAFEWLMEAGDRRTQVIEAMCRKVKGLRASEFWGKGALLFAPVERIDSEHGLKNRLTPLLCSTPVDMGVNLVRRTQWEKSLVNAKIVSGIQVWLNFVTLHENTGPRGYVRKCFCDLVSTKYKGKHPFVQTNELLKDLQKHVSKKKQQAETLRRNSGIQTPKSNVSSVIVKGDVIEMCKDGSRATQKMITKKTIGAKRTRGWGIDSQVVYPNLISDGSMDDWEEGDDDAVPEAMALESDSTKDEDEDTVPEAMALESDSSQSSTSSLPSKRCNDDESVDLTTKKQKTFCGMPVLVQRTDHDRTSQTITTNGTYECVRDVEIASLGEFSDDYDDDEEYKP